jgi:hypothetical protein
MPRTVHYPLAHRPRIHVAGSLLTWTPDHTKGPARISVVACGIRWMIARELLVVSSDRRNLVVIRTTNVLGSLCIQNELKRSRSYGIRFGCHFGDFAEEVAPFGKSEQNRFEGA